MTDDDPASVAEVTAAQRIMARACDEVRILVAQIVGVAQEYGHGDITHYGVEAAQSLRRLESAITAQRLGLR